MTLPKLGHNFHDAAIASITVGPRREVTLIVGLDDPDYPSHHPVYIRFGGITNFSEVSSFLEHVPEPKTPETYRARIDALDFDTEQPSKQNSLIFRLELDGVGQILIRCLSFE